MIVLSGPSIIILVTKNGYIQHLPEPFSSPCLQQHLRKDLRKKRGYVP